MSLRRRQSEYRGRQGFALVVSLVLMALIVLLVASIGTVGRVQSRLAETRQAQALARQQAFYALGLAMGQLQEAAGHDQRSTARAEILGQGQSAQPYWTGVWDFTRSDNPTPRWLVTEDPLAAPGDRPVPTRLPASPTTLIGFGTVGGKTGLEVAVPQLELTGTNAAGQSVVSGRIAWWTADEGVKVSLSAVENPVVDDLTWRQANSAPRWETLFNSIDQDDIPTTTRLKELLTFRQLKTEDNFGAEAAVFEDHYHDITFAHLALLTNPLDGGLKLNIQDAQANPVTRFDDVFGKGDVARVWDEWTEALEFDADGAPQLTLTPITVSAFEGLEEGAPYRNVAPVLSEVTLFMSFFHHHSFNEPTTRHYYDAEFTNPFRYGLLLNASDRRALTVDTTGLPDYTLTVEGTNPGQFGPYDLDRMQMSSGSAATSSWMEFDETPEGSYSGEARLKAGEVYRLRDRDPDKSPQGLIKRTNDSSMRVGTAFKTSGDRIILAARFKPEPVTISVYEGAAVGGDVIFQLRDLELDDFQYLFDSPLSEEYAMGRNPNFGEAEQTVAYHAALGRDFDWQSEETAEFLRLTDLRAPVFSVARGEVRMASTNPVDLQDTDTGIHQDTELFADSAWRDSTYGSYSDMRLYDVPVGNPLTLSAYRLLPFKGLPPNALGRASSSPLLKEMNAVYDRYFLAAPSVSGVSTFENTHLEVLPNAPASVDPLAENVAQYLAANGAFNWHSTSAFAWKAALHQAFTETHPVRYTDPNSRVQELPVERALSGIFRHPFGAMSEVDLEEDVTIAGMGEDDLRRVYFQQGVRLLDEESLDDLSAGIVSELQLRGRPFASLSDFLNDGLLDRALERSGVNAGFLPHANGYIDQGDLAALLSLSPTVRSDTFTIRVSSEILNPTTGERTGAVVLEARIQRSPEYLDGSPPESIPSSSLSEAGRRFNIQSFRWLDLSNDI